MADDSKGCIDPEGSTDSRGATTVRPAPGLGRVVAMAAVLGGSVLGAVLWSRLPPSPAGDGAAAPMTAASAVPDASGTEAGAGDGTEPAAGLAVLEPGEPPAPEQEAAATYAAAPEPATPDAQSAPSSPASAPAPAVLTSRLVPFPVPRPPEFRSGRMASPAPRVAARRALPVAAAPPEDTRSFMEKLFGIDGPEPPRLAYAALETKPTDSIFRRALNIVPSAGGVAVYDIRAKVVTLPNGEKLEAHSGLGESMDDPGHVHVRMKGPTPVGTYDISEREQPFHGVRALRLNPQGGPEAVHGRVGLLAHTYMLGASGASNGCVSFKDYDKFLQAYLRGEVQRLVVVAGG